MDDLLDKIYEELINMYENHIKDFLTTLIKSKGWKERKKKEIFNYDPDAVHFIGNIELISEDYNILIHTMLFDYYKEKKEYSFGLWIQITRADNGYYHHLGMDGGQCTLKSLDELSKNTRKIMEELWNKASKEIERKYSNKLMWQLGIETLKHFVAPIDYVHIITRKGKRSFIYGETGKVLLDRLFKEEDCKTCRVNNPIISFGDCLGCIKLSNHIKLKIPDIPRSHFHAKWYAGIIGNRVEIIITSHNLTKTGKHQPETVGLLIMDNNDYEKKFLSKLKI